MCRVVLVLLLLLALLPLGTRWSSEAVAAVCMRSDVMFDTLRMKHKEVPMYWGATSSGWLIVIFINVETGTWTIVRNFPRKLSCIVDAGDGWTGPLVTEDKDRVSTH